MDETFLDPKPSTTPQGPKVPDYPWLYEKLRTPVSTRPFDPRTDVWGDQLEED